MYTPRLYSISLYSILTGFKKILYLCVQRLIASCSTVGLLHNYVRIFYFMLTVQFLYKMQTQVSLHFWRVKKTYVDSEIMKRRHT